MQQMRKKEDNPGGPQMNSLNLIPSLINLLKMAFDFIKRLLE
jgi:hypothetical protein